MYKRICMVFEEACLPGVWQQAMHVCSGEHGEHVCILTPGLCIEGYNIYYSYARVQYIGFIWTDSTTFKTG